MSTLIWLLFGALLVTTNKLGDNLLVRILAVFVVFPLIVAVFCVVYCVFRLGEWEKSWHT